MQKKTCCPFPYLEIFSFLLLFSIPGIEKPLLLIAAKPVLTCPSRWQGVRWQRKKEEKRKKKIGESKCRLFIGISTFIVWYYKQSTHSNSGGYKHYSLHGDGWDCPYKERKALFRLCYSFFFCCCCSDLNNPFFLFLSFPPAVRCYVFLYLHLEKKESLCLQGGCFVLVDVVVEFVIFGCTKLELSSVC